MFKALKRWFGTEGPVTRYAYVSRAAKGIDGYDVVQIADQAQRFNRRHGLTGVLLFNGGQFFQILEGSAPAVDALRARIAADPRHDSMRDTHRDEGPRLFSDWAMKVVLFDTGRAEAPPQAMPDALADQWRRVSDLR